MTRTTTSGAPPSSFVRSVVAVGPGLTQNRIAPPQVPVPARSIRHESWPRSNAARVWVWPGLTRRLDREPLNRAEEHELRDHFESEAVRLADLHLAFGVGFGKVGEARHEALLFVVLVELQQPQLHAPFKRRQAAGNIEHAEAKVLQEHELGKVLKRPDHPREPQAGDRLEVREVGEAAVDSLGTVQIDLAEARQSRHALFHGAVELPTLGQTDDLDLADSRQHLDASGDPCALGHIKKGEVLHSDNISNVASEAPAVGEVELPQSLELHEHLQGARHILAAGDVQIFEQRQPAQCVNRAGYVDTPAQVKLGEVFEGRELLEVARERVAAREVEADQVELRQGRQRAGDILIHASEVEMLEPL
mmetsp:Transcript_26548/g.62255  ORF Transcript_26548/g.62255 Transcript_26548/m.62255 type:complete len:363 (+) Transcript_26548:164-1252(+)